MINEKELIMKSQTGDFEAFEKLLYIYEKQIYRFIYKMTFRKEDAEDLTQETFIKFYKFLNKVDPEKGCRAILYKIATNTAYDWLRKRRGKIELLVINDPEHPLETLDEKSSYYSDRERNENVENLAGWLERIKPVYKTVLLLYYIEDLNYKEIAITLSIPINTVKTYLHRAKIELKNTIEKYGPAYKISKRTA